MPEETLISVWCTCRFEALHFWPGASSILPEVAYLEAPHRHMFHVRVELEVQHGNRAIEFVTLQHEVVEFVRKTYEHKVHTNSCETFALGILESVQVKYKVTKITVSVSEDGENGAIVTRQYYVKGLSHVVSH